LTMIMRAWSLFTCCARVETGARISSAIIAKASTDDGFCGLIIVYLNIRAAITRWHN
jgi:hypothetical protein